MLFNSPEFIFVFLPIVLIGLVIVRRAASGVGRLKAMQGWLVATSLAFYGWWEPVYLVLIVASVLFNFAVGKALGRTGQSPAILTLGVAGNVAVLGMFKYTDFVLSNVNFVGGLDLPLQGFILPLGISFFTFQQIAYLVDRHRGEVHDHGFLQYALFVVFFPQLIAGPIVHHKQMMPQLAKGLEDGLKPINLALGLTAFAIGLFKKVVIADEMAKFSTPVFMAADAGGAPSLFEAWGGALAYTFQLYFDFSGYSDMAIGLGLLVGLRLPLNFNSPYKANNIIDFWRRWHMTLSAFLKDYLYVPLGGNRRGPLMRYRNLMLTMLLGGLWHGAAWPFVLWGGLHGLFLVINHLWRHLRQRVFPAGAPTRLGTAVARLVTFLAITVAWILFRAETVDGAAHILEGMMGLNGIVVTTKFLPGLAVFDAVTLSDTQAMGALQTTRIFFWVPALLILVWAVPNTGQIVAFQDGGARLTWRPRLAWGTLTCGLLSACLYEMVYRENKVTEFLYFQF